MPSILLDFRDPNLLLPAGPVLVPPGDLFLFDPHGDAIPDRKLVNLKRSKELLVLRELVVWLRGLKVNKSGRERMGTQRPKSQSEDEGRTQGRSRFGFFTV